MGMVTGRRALEQDINVKHHLYYSLNTVVEKQKLNIRYPVLHEVIDSLFLCIEWLNLASHFLFTWCHKHFDC